MKIEFKNGLTKLMSIFLTINYIQATLKPFYVRLFIFAMSDIIQRSFKIKV